MTTLMKNNRKVWWHSVGLCAIVLLMSMLVPTLCLAQIRIIPVGLGYSDVSPHQLVRDNTPPDGYVYIVAPRCPGIAPRCFSISGMVQNLVVYKSDSPDRRFISSFVSLPVPQPASTITNVTSTAIAIDNSNTIHTLWNVMAGFVYYATFNTSTNQWSTPLQVDTANMYHSRKATAAGVWSTWSLFLSSPPRIFDSTVSTRWSQFSHYFPALVDILYWDSRNFPDRNTLYFSTLP